MQNEQRRPGGGGAAGYLATGCSEYTAPEALGQAALLYAGYGWPVFPVEARGKRPLGRLAPNGVHSATTDRATLARWWRMAPTANIGLACGLAFWVLDVDGEAGREALAQLEGSHGRLPATVEASTGSGGRHCLFQPEARVQNSVKRLGAGLDTRAAGGYIAAAPSIHPNGQRYRWLDGHAPGEVEIAEAPAWLLDLFDPPRPEPVAVPFVPASTRAATRYAEAAFEAELERVAYAAPGERNNALNRAAYSLGQLAGAGLLDPHEVAAALAGAALATGLDRQEAGKTLASGLRSGMANPRTVA